MLQARKRVYLLHAGGDDAGDKAGPKKGSSRKRKARGPPQEADDTAGEPVMMLAMQATST